MSRRREKLQQLFPEVFAEGGKVDFDPIRSKAQVDISASIREYANMRTTLDIPEPLYKQAKIRAVEEGSTLRDLLLRGLQHELAAKPATIAKPNISYWANRQMLPEYEAALKEGAFSGGTDSTQIISEERDAW